MTHAQAHDVVEAASRSAVTEYLTVSTVANVVTATVCITDHRLQRQARYVDFEAAMAHVLEANEAVSHDIVAQALHVVRSAEARLGEDSDDSTAS